jgi:hypothetical protein
MAAPHQIGRGLHAEALGFTGRLLARRIHNDRAAGETITGAITRAVTEGLGTEGLSSKGPAAGWAITGATGPGGPISKGTLAEGAVGGRLVAEGALAVGAITKRPIPARRAITEGTLPEGTIAAGALAEGTVTAGARAAGATTETALTRTAATPLPTATSGGTALKTAGAISAGTTLKPTGPGAGAVIASRIRTGTTAGFATTLGPPLGTPPFPLAGLEATGARRPLAPAARPLIRTAFKTWAHGVGRRRLWIVLLQVI